MALKWFKFKTGQSITAKNLNEQLQDNIVQRVHFHDHSADPVNPTGGTSPQGPRIWSDFVYIGDVIGNTGGLLDLSAYDHVHNTRIHRGDSSEQTLSVNTENRMTFSYIKPSDWEWMDHYWEAEVALPAGLYEDCAYLVYFQPFFNENAAAVAGSINPSANFRSLQGVVPLNNKLLSYNVMAHSIESGKFKVRLYAVGQGLRYGVIGRSEFQGMKEGREWEVRRVVDGNFMSPSQVQVIDDRTYVLSEGSNKIVVFSNVNGAIVDVIRPPDPTYTVKSFGATRDVAVDWADDNEIPDPWEYRDKLSYTTTLVCHNEDKAKVYAYREGLFQLLSDAALVLEEERKLSATLLRSVEYDSTINLVDKFELDWPTDILSRIAGKLSGGSAGTTSKRRNTEQMLLNYKYSERFNIGLGHDSALASWGDYSTFSLMTDKLEVPRVDFSGRNGRTYGAYRSQPGLAVPRPEEGTEPTAEGSFSHYFGSWGDDLVVQDQYSGTLPLVSISGVQYTARRGFSGSKPYQFTYNIIDIDPKGDAQLVSEQVGLETVYSVIVGVTDVESSYSIDTALKPEKVKVQLPSDVVPFAITSVVFVKKIINGGPNETHHNPQLIMVLCRADGGYRIMTYFYYESLPNDGTPYLMDVTGSGWNVLDGQNRWPLIGTDWMIGSDPSIRIFDDMASKHEGITLTDFDATLWVENIDANESRYRIALYFSDARNHCVHVYQAVSDGPYLQHNVGADQLSTGTRFQFAQWERDLDVGALGSLSGHVSATGKQAGYIGDWNVMPEWAMPLPVNMNTAYGEYYNGQLRKLRAGFGTWPGDMARMAKYDIVGDGLIDNGDYLTPFMADNPLSKMGWAMYTRPMSYQGRQTVGDVFTFDPRIVQQIMVRPYTNPALVESDEPAFSQPYLAFTPKVVNNGYVLQNESNSLNTYCNTFFQVNDPDIEYIDIDYDLGQKVEAVGYLDGNYVMGLTFLNQYSMVIRESTASGQLVNPTTRLSAYSEWNINSQNRTSVPFSNNINLDNFALALVVPSTSSQPAGWNWMLFRKRGGANELTPSGTNQPAWFAIDDARLLTEDDGIAAGEIIYRVRLQLLQPAKDRLMATPISGFHGLEPGMSVPFAPTHLKQTKIFTDNPTLGSIYDTVVPKPHSTSPFLINPGEGSVTPSPVGALTNWSDMERMTVGGPIPPYTLSELQRTTYGQGGFLDTVQIYDAPMSRGGLWFYLMSPPLRIFPKYLSRFVCPPDTVSYQLGGPDLPYFYAGQTIEDAKCGWGNPVTINSDLTVDSGFSIGNSSGSLCLRDFRYYRVLRGIKLLRSSDV